MWRQHTYEVHVCYYLVLSGTWYYLSPEPPTAVVSCSFCFVCIRWVQWEERKSDTSHYTSCRFFFAPSFPSPPALLCLIPVSSSSPLCCFCPCNSSCLRVVRPCNRYLFLLSTYHTIIRCSCSLSFLILASHASEHLSFFFFSSFFLLSFFVFFFRGLACFVVVLYPSIHLLFYDELRLFGLLWLTAVCDHKNCFLWDEEPARTLGVLMALGRNNGLLL